MAASFLIAGLIRFESYENFAHATDILSALICVLLVHSVVFYVMKLYEGIFTRGLYQEFVRVIKYNILLFLGVAGFSFAVKNVMEFSRATLLYFIILNQFFVFLIHRFLHEVGTRHYLRSGSASRVLLICHQADADRVIQRLSQPSDSNWNYVITGVALLESAQERLKQIESIPVVAGREDILDYAVKGIVDEAFIYADSSEQDTNYFKHLILELEKTGIVVDVNVPMLDLGNESAKRIYRMGPYYVMAFTTRLYDYRMMLIKRLLDILGSIVGLIVTGIATIFVAPAIKLESKGPVFFHQTRVGKNGRPFEMYKFRSMYEDAEDRKQDLMDQNEMQGNMFKITDDPRITRVGKFIRRTSIDELPQFWNVFKGDMSLVGTRPPTLEEYEQYEGWQKRRISFKPGITGLWQISGRSNIRDFNKVVRMDLEYIDNWSLSLDVKILLKTVVAVFKGVGAK